MILADVQPAPVTTPAAAELDQLAQHRRRVAELEQLARHQSWTLRCLNMVAGHRETERARHRDEVLALERRIADLHGAVVDMLAVFTDEKWPNAPGARVRSGWVDHRRVRGWRAQVVEAEPDTVSAVDTEEAS